jgi:hypothetical protein
MIPERVPTGFVELGSDDDDSFVTLEELESGDEYGKIPCTLYTDRHGVNFFVIEMNGKKHILPVGTD